VRRINDIGLEGIILEGKLTAVAFVYLDSIPCGHFLPEFQKLSCGEVPIPDGIACYVIDAGENPKIADDLKVMAVPTTLLLRDGKELGRFEGPYSCEALSARIEERLR
jgi:hypothetical protein